MVRIKSAKLNFIQLVEGEKKMVLEVFCNNNNNKHICTLYVWRKLWIFVDVVYNIVLDIATIFLSIKKTL